MPCGSSRQASQSLNGRLGSAGVTTVGQSSIRRRLGALQEREFRLLWAGQLVSAVGDALVPVAVAFAVLDLTGSAADLGLVLAALMASGSSSSSPAASGPTACRGSS